MGNHYWENFKTPEEIKIISKNTDTFKLKMELFYKLFGLDYRVKPGVLNIKKDMDDIIPVSQHFLDDLEKDILEMGIMTPLILWNDVLIDGWKRFEIAKKHNLKFTYIKKKFKNELACEIWLLNRKMNHDNLNDMNKFKVCLLLADKKNQAEEEPVNFENVVFGTDKEYEPESKMIKKRKTNAEELKFLEQQKIFMKSVFGNI